MLFGWFYYDWTVLIVLPGLLLTLIAQGMVQSAYRKGADTMLPSMMTGASVARRILDSNGLSHIRIEMTHGHLTDHYDPRTKVLRLSQSVYHGNNAAAVGVAAHEAGHALQDAKGYAFLRFRIALVPICNFGAALAMPLFIIGLLLAGLSPYGMWIMLGGIGLFSLTVLFQLITLPVEFNASRRAMRCLDGSGTMTDQQLKTSRRVLSAAAMTYVASLAVSLLNLLRLLVIASRGSRRK